MSPTRLVVPVRTEDKESIEIPADMMLDIRLTTEVDSETSAVGDQVTATLDQKLTVRRRAPVPEGATLAGRILRLERQRRT